MNVMFNLFTFSQTTTEKQNMRKTKAQAQQTKQQLLDAALEAFWQNGVTNTSMQTIAEQAGMTRGALYWHFKNKEDLFEALFEQMCAPFMQKMEQVLTHDKDALTQLKLKLNELLLLLNEDEKQRKFCHVVYLKCEYTNHNATIMQLAKHYYELGYHQIFQVLSLCQQQGSIPKESNIEIITLFLKSTLIGFLKIWFLNPEISITTVGPTVIEAAINTIQHQIITA